MTICSNCNSDNTIKINLEVNATEKAFKLKDYYDWNIKMYFCMDCNNIFGVKK